MGSKKELFSNVIELRVPFYHLDPLQVVWHGNYFKYFEEARFALFDKIGIDLHSYYEKTGIIFPITKTEVKHIRSLRNGDRFLCKASLRQGDYKIVIDFEIKLKDQNKVYTRGRSEQVAVMASSGEVSYKLPDDIRSALDRVMK